MQNIPDHQHNIHIVTSTLLRCLRTVRYDKLIATASGLKSSTRVSKNPCQKSQVKKILQAREKTTKSGCGFVRDTLSWMKESNLENESENEWVCKRFRASDNPWENSPGKKSTQFISPDKSNDRVNAINLVLRT